MVKAEWFKRHSENERPERFDPIVQSWDTANKATELSDFSVCTTWGVSASSRPSVRSHNTAQFPITVLLLGRILRSCSESVDADRPCATDEDEQ
jgi:hypothetical protein